MGLNTWLRLTRHVCWEDTYNSHVGPPSPTAQVQRGAGWQRGVATNRGGVTSTHGDREAYNKHGNGPAGDARVRAQPGVPGPGVMSWKARGRGAPPQQPTPLPPHGPSRLSEAAREALQTARGSQEGSGNV